MPAWPMFAALAELLLAAPGCSFILLGVLVQLTFNSDAVATLTSAPPLCLQALHTWMRSICQARARTLRLLQMAVQEMSL